MSESKVAIVKGTDPKMMVKSALQMINAKNVVSTGDRVLLKPNCVVPKHPSTGVTTDARILDGIIEFLLDNGVKDITIGEGGNRHTDRAFDVTGIREIALRYDIDLVNFNNDDYEVMEIPSAESLHKVPIAKTVLNSTCIVNIPKLKIHHMAQVTLSIKNLMGTIVGDRGAIMHRHIDYKLVDLAGVIKPKINVVDGIVGSEMDEVRGKPIQMNLILAGIDMVSVDIVGSAVMGVDPRTVRHLQLAGKKGLGVTSLDDIFVIGETIKSVERKFNRNFSKDRLKAYGFDHDVTEEVLRPLWDETGSNLPPTLPQNL